MCVKCRLDGELPAGRKAVCLRYIARIPLLHMDGYENTCYAWRRTTAKEVFFMMHLKQKFVDSCNELKHLKNVVTVALFIAIGVVLGFMFSIQLTDFIKIGFSFIANEMTALLFGPVVGGLMGGITDILKFLVKPTGPFFFGFTLNAILGGVIYGAILYHSPISFKRILAAKAVVAVFVNLLLGTFWLDMMYGQGFIALLPARALKQLFTVPIESIIFFVFVEALSKAKVLAALKTKA